MATAPSAGRTSRAYCALRPDVSREHPQPAARDGERRPAPRATGHWLSTQKTTRENTSHGTTSPAKEANTEILSSDRFQKIYCETAHKESM